MLMAKKVIILILVIFLADTAAAGRSKKAKPLAEGFVLSGVDGKLVGDDSKERSKGRFGFGNTDRWFFEFASDVNDSTGRIRAGQRLELLPSSSLENMTADVKKRRNADYRLWARVTKYNGKNFLFAIYFLPLSKAAEPASSTSQEPQQQAEMSINEPNDILMIPEEITGGLATGKIIRAGPLGKSAKLEADFILADRTAFLGRRAGGDLVLVLDALGRDIQRISFRPLPCQALEQAWRKQSEQFQLLRFKIAGIVTEYKGERYLLLRRTARVYSHENFGN